MVDPIYSQFPAVDQDLNFPPEVRAKLASSMEIAAPTGGAANWRLGPDLIAADLNTVLATGAYRQTGSTNATLARNYPVDQQSGVLTVIERIPGTSIEQIYKLTSGRVEYHRWMNSGVWTAWYAFTMNRVSQTAGRVIYTWDDINSREQIVYGDTGVRDILGLIDTSKVTVGTAKLRRFNNQVELRVLGVLGVGANTSNVSILTAALPAGFRNEHTIQVQAFLGDDLQTSAALSFNGGALTVKALRTSNPSASFLMQWQTLDSWPTSLPGNPVGSLPNA